MTKHFIPLSWEPVICEAAGLFPQIFLEENLGECLDSIPGDSPMLAAIERARAKGRLVPIHGKAK